jgi:hypothetical protein
MCSTIHSANDFDTVTRRIKDKEGNWVQRLCKKPKIVDDYNQNMKGVDHSDQIIAPYNVLLKCRRYMSKFKQKIISK